MTAPEITVATPAERGRVTGSLVAAFTNDPVLRYLFPDDATYPRYAAAFFGHLFDKRVRQATIWTVGNGASVAMWDAPAAERGPPGEALAAQLPADALARVNAYNEVVHAVLPATPFWYLGALGTHPDHAGRRWGHAVMGAGLRRAAADGLPAVLETSNPANVEVYRRAGWEVVRVATAEPLTIWVMQQSTGTYHAPGSAGVAF
ncbi:MAG TPA: GNAT family N-acetyltransferase [Micromonosporaceae bacterium]|nr:GNAT family N-acetyltransferase [Micromonosporaceae bacterium]